MAATNGEIAGAVQNGLEAARIVTRLKSQLRRLPELASPPADGDGE